MGIASFFKYEESVHMYKIILFPIFYASVEYITITLERERERERDFM